MACGLMCTLSTLHTTTDAQKTKIDPSNVEHSIQLYESHRFSGIFQDADYAQMPENEHIRDFHKNLKQFDHFVP